MFCNPLKNGRRRLIPRLSTLSQETNLLPRWPSTVRERQTLWFNLQVIAVPIVVFRFQKYLTVQWRSFPEGSPWQGWGIPVLWLPRETLKPKPNGNLIRRLCSARESQGKEESVRGCLKALTKLSPREVRGMWLWIFPMAMRLHKPPPPLTDTSGHIFGCKRHRGRISSEGLSNFIPKRLI